MPNQNNPAEDRYNPPGLNGEDFETFKLSEINVGELFWMDPNNKDTNHAWRKLDDDGICIDTKLQQNYKVSLNETVYVKI